jgi:VWFA-related protein
VTRLYSTGALVLFAALPAFAQVATRVDVKVINVDVSAIDASGNAVADLTKDDFEVFEDNRPQTITNFTVIDNAVRSAQPRESTDLQFRRKLILLVDNNYIEKRDRNAALDKLDAFIDETFDGTYEWAIGMIGQRLELLQTFTTDKAAIHAAVARVRKAATTALRDDMADRSFVSDSLNQLGSPSDFAASAGFESRERTTRNARSMTNTARGLVDTARAFATSEGKKLIVLLTGAMDINTTFGAYDRGADRELQDTKIAIAKLIDFAVREANAANTSIHVLNAAPHTMAAVQHDVQNQSSGLGRAAVNQAGIGFTASADTADVSTPFRLAAGTGGLYLASNEVRDSYKAVNAASSRYYLLGYTPSHDDDGQYHRITVKVKRPGLRLSHRQGYVDLSADERLEQLLRLRVSLLQPAAAVPVTVNLGTTPATDGKPVLSILAAMPMSKVTLLQSQGRYSGRVHVYLSIFDGKGKNVGFHHKTQDLAFTEEQRARAIADAFRYRMNVRLPGGEFTIALTLRDDLSQEIGTAVQKVRL